MPFKSVKDIPRGYVFNSMFYRRMYQQNKNILMAVIGKTGSGKSWACLSICESWYKFKWGIEYNPKNVCFTIDDLIQRLQNGNLRQGEILILEEAGVNVGNLDFQNKISKAFNYILQSFRSLNVGLIVNLPYFSMLNRQTRMLMHMMVETKEIDRKNKTCIIKPLLLDYNQRSGDEYHHYPKVLVDGLYAKIHQVTYDRPSDKLVNEYEIRKKAFVMGTIDNAGTESMMRNKITEPEAQAYYLKYICNLTYSEISEIMRCPPANTSKYITRALKKGISEENIKNYEFLYRKYTNLTKRPLMPTPVA